MPSAIIEEKFDVIVVGAGWNGLIAARTYLQLAPSVNLLIVDGGKSIGGVWSKEKIYPNLYAQSGYGLFEYSCKPMPNEGITKDGYIASETVNKYLNDFAEENDLVRRTRLETEVNRVERRNGGGWKLELEHGSDLECEKLIYAAGPTSHPVVPKWPNYGFEKPVIHSSDTGTSLDALSGVQRATVVGAAKSSYDTVFFLLKAGKKVDWIIREEGSGPLAITPPRFFGFNAVGVCSTRAVASFSPSIMNTQGLWYRSIQRTRVGRAAARNFWWLINYICESHAGYTRNENAKKLRPDPPGDGAFWANAGLGVASVPDYWKVFHAGDCTVHRTEVASLGSADTLHLKNGTDVHTDFVILCTGFDKPYHAFSKELQGEFGLAYDSSLKWEKLDARGEAQVNTLLPYLQRLPAGARTDTKEAEHTHNLLHGPSRHYRRLIVPQMAAQGDRSIYFPGLIHTIFTPLVSELQALWGVSFLLGRLDIPSQDTMELEAATFNAWTRKRYLAQGKKHAYAIYDYLSYIDTLARDLGIKTSRKSNAFSEMFIPYRPNDYRGLVDEYLEFEKRVKYTGKAQ